MSTDSDDFVIGKYKVMELVGSGGLGEVYKAIDTRNGDVVALKRLHDKYQTNKKLLGLFHKEIMIHSRVSHKHCVKFIEADLRPPNAHIVTNFINGINCHNLVRKSGPVPALIACSIVLDMLQGLEHLHCMDIVHSDMTPSNIIVENTGKVVLADFGLSCNQGIEDYAGMTVGTPGYQAPERLQHAPITTLADIYGAGVIFHELLRGERLFIGLMEENLDRKMRDLDFEWINTGHKPLDDQLQRIFRTALSYKPDKRYPTPRDFMHAIYLCLKMFDVRYTRRAILQWLIDVKLSNLQVEPPIQNVYGNLQTLAERNNL